MALISFFRKKKKLKSNMKHSFLAFTCSKYMYSVSGNETSDILFYKKEIKKKTAFSYFDQKQKCSVFTFVQYILPR